LSSSGEILFRARWAAKFSSNTWCNGIKFLKGYFWSELITIFLTPENVECEKCLNNKFNQLIMQALVHIVRYYAFGGCKAGEVWLLYMGNNNTGFQLVTLHINSIIQPATTTENYFCMLKLSLCTLNGFYCVSATG
jgi:hypothetical protein